MRRIVQVWMMQFMDGIVQSQNGGMLNTFISVLSNHMSCRSTIDADYFTGLKFC